MEIEMAHRLHFDPVRSWIKPVLSMQWLPSRGFAMHLPPAPTPRNTYTKSMSSTNIKTPGVSQIFPNVPSVVGFWTLSGLRSNASESYSTCTSPWPSSLLHSPSSRKRFRWLTLSLLVESQSQSPNVATPLMVSLIPSNCRAVSGALLRRPSLVLQVALVTHRLPTGKFKKDLPHTRGILA